LQYVNIYDVDNFKLSYSNKSWNETGTLVVSGDSTHNYHYIAGINDLITHENFINVNPNPTTGKITLRSTKNINAIEIFSVNGRLVFSDYIANYRTSEEIDLSGQARGIYFIRVSSGSKIHNTRIVLQ
jgi:hypothetical protein